MRRAIAVVSMAVSMGLAPVAPAAAATCAGTQNTLVVCVDPTGTTLYEDCIYAGDPPCTPVSVPGPKVWCEGAMGPNCDPWH